jgi:hypothetical protein
LSCASQFEVTEATRDALQAWIKQAGLGFDDFLLLHDDGAGRDLVSMAHLLT